uniref:CSON001064 protein n=1 Tax=Culicoides sonorensis TaxID=179676 RepID=A0A336LRA1_CULSO
MDTNRMSVKRKTEYGDEENMFLDNSSTLVSNGNHKIMKSLQYDPLESQSSPNTHTVIELMPVHEPLNNKNHGNDLNVQYSNGQNIQQQFIELANVAFDHGSFINLDNIVHQSQNIDPHNTAYAQTIWNGNDLIVLQNCNSAVLSEDPKLNQHYQIHETSGHNMIMESGNIMSAHVVPTDPGKDQQLLNNHDPDPGVSGQQEDADDKNLSWLLNFKLDELPHLSPEAKRKAMNSSNTDGNGQEKTCFEDDDTNVGENIVVENYTAKTPKKPPFTYTELIEYALEDQGELTVSGIYQWISDRFKYYKSNDDRWKNSVRHNLSINPHFRKGSKASQGAGHLWTISSRDSEVNILAWEHKKQRLELFFKMEESAAKRDSEAASYSNDEAMIAAANIMPRNENEGSQQSAQSVVYHTSDLGYQNQQQNHQIEYENGGHTDIRRSAGEILNGIKRNVEVQIMHPSDTNNSYQSYTILDSDYLNPIPKDEVVQECGLRTTRRTTDIGNEYYVTTIDPIELGINMHSNTNEEILFEDDFNFNYFGSNIMA